MVTSACGSCAVSIRQTAIAPIAGQTGNYDGVEIDNHAHRLYIADRTDSGVDVFDTSKASPSYVGTIFLGRLYGVPLGVADYFTVVAAGMALSFATPGVPNGAFLLLAPLLASLGLPPAGVALLIAVDAIPDLFATASNVTGDFAAVSIVRRLAGTPRPDVLTST